MVPIPQRVRCQTSLDRGHRPAPVVRGAVLVLVAVLTGCGAAASPPGGDSTSEPPSAATSASASAQPAEPAVTTTDDTVPEVTSTIAGSAVAGNSGGTGENQTDSASETVRADDGTCTGWPGRRGGTWTEGLVDGARITVRDSAGGAVLGTGRLGAGTSKDVGTGGRSQWMCTFPFTAQIRGTVPETLQLDVSGARSMTARRDARGRFVASVSTDAAARLVPTCDGLPAGPATGVWDPVVGLYWNGGLDQLCSNGIAPTVVRVCRPAGIGSDYVVAVVATRDRSVVYEDTAGVRLTDPAVLGDAPRVVVLVATGQPCP